MNNPLQDIPGPIVLAGIGNTLKGDDGAGSIVAASLAGRRTDLVIIDCGDIPENYLRELSAHRAGALVFIDATDMNEPSGSVRLFESKDIAVTGVFTHGMSLAMIAEYVATATGCPVYLLGIQPEKTHMGDPVTPEVARAIDTLVNTLAGTL